jgi:hypothetical protein
MVDDRISRIGGRDHAYIWDPEARRANLNPLRHQDANPQLRFPLNKQEAHGCVRPSVGLLAGVSLQELAINVLAVRFVTRREIFLDAHH